MIQSFALEFSSEDEMLKTANRLWKQLSITGEMEMLPLSNGEWRLTIHSEKQLRESTIEKLPGKRVQAKSVITSDKFREQANAGD